MRVFSKLGKSENFPKFWKTGQILENVFGKFILQIDEQ